MPIKLDLLRPEDLLNLQIEGENLRLDTSQPDGPALVAEDPQKTSYLIVTFPPQTAAEQAFYESSPTNPPPDEAAQPYNQPPPAGPVPSVPVQARIGRNSRLVFSIPAGSNPVIPYTSAGLLDWESLALNVSPLAGLPPEPSPQERQSAPGIAEPGRLETAIELPYRLVLSPNREAAFRHARQPKTTAGFTELWHTRLVHKTAAGELLELSRRQPAPLRAIWSPDYNPQKFLASDPPQFGQPDSDWGILTPMTAFDRHEIVVLTSAFHGYVRDKDDFRPYLPQPVWAEQLMLSPLGGWLTSRGEWDPPAPFRPYRIISPIVRSDWERFVQDFVRRQPGFDFDPNLLEPFGAGQPDLETAGPSEAAMPMQLDAAAGQFLAALPVGVEVENMSSLLWS
jgi:hypothetical protein